MRRVDRGLVSEPKCLEAMDRSGKTERERARAHQDDLSPGKGPFNFLAYKHDEVKKKLAMLFHGKCAYCETFYSAAAPVDVEHYRPKGAVSEDPDHPGYWWLAMSWDNLLPSCIDCNRRRKQSVPSASTSLEYLYSQSCGTGMQSVQSGKKDSFPIAQVGNRLKPEQYTYDLEMALLLDPTRHDPREHLHYHINRDAPIGLVLSGKSPGETSELGAVSIQTYGLNRLGLVQDRTRLLRRLEFLGDLVLELGHIICELEATELRIQLVEGVVRRLRLLQDRTLAEMREMAHPAAPYSEMARAWIEDFKAQLTAEP